MGESQNKKTTTLVLVGKTGNGKSSTGNSILGYRAFKAQGTFTSVTKQCEMKSAVRKDGLELRVVDTPGLFDSCTPERDVTKEIKRCIDLAKDGVHGVLLVLSLNRFTPEEASVVDWLQIMFGPDVMKYMVIVFTAADTLEDDDLTFEERLENSPKRLRDILNLCNNRVALFNNKTKSPQEKEKQVDELLKKVDRIVAENGGQPYSNELFQKFQELARRLNGQEEHSGSHSGHSLKETADLLRQINETVENRVNKTVVAMQEQLALEHAAHQNALNQINTLATEIAKLKNDKETEILTMKNYNEMEIMKLKSQKEAEIAQLRNQIKATENRGRRGTCSIM